MDWIDHERARMLREADRNTVEAGGMVQPAARGELPGEPRATYPRQPLDHVPDSPLAIMARRRERRHALRRLAYRMSIAALAAVLVAALAVAIFTQVNAARLDWPEIQTDARK